MATAPQPIRFVIPGQLLAERAGRPAAGRATRGRIASSVRVGAQRGGAAAVRVDARPGEDVVVLGIANGPTLVLHPEHARDLLLAQGAGASRGEVDALAANGVAVPAQLGWPGLEAAGTRSATRGWLGQAALDSFEVITGLAKDPAVDLATAAITRRLDGAVNAGVYALTQQPLPESFKKAGWQPAAVPAAPAGEPILVLVHGTFVDTVSTFGKLWSMHPAKVRELFQRYGGRVYALDHPTLAASPIANALTLVQALPRGARLHLITHSRGGLVAEVLARACGGGPLAEAELAHFDKPGYEQHRADLRKLVKMAQDKQLAVERTVRVACPAHGTLLASKRLDAYLSVLQWALELGSVPVLPELVDFLHEIARRRSRPTELPGLEAMMPGSAVVAWLNARGQPVPGDLRVVAGDMEGDSIGSWVKTLLSDAFYWTDNDLVVQTRSMYGGMPRGPVPSGAGADASFLLDRGAKVSHFNYFANERTAAAITQALVQAAAPPDFAAIGPLSWAGKDASGTRAAKAVARSRGPAGAAADRPAVFVLPGILGSNLKRDGKRIWLGAGFVNALLELRWDPATADRVQPDGPVAGSYDELIERLADTHEVIPFAFDWRRPIEDEARRLAAAVDAALVARNASGQPVRLIAHSMGGLVARTMQLEKPDTWKRMMAREGARLLMLGTPNGGSWSPMQTLSGDDTFGNTLVALGSLFDNRKARAMMAALPGFIQLQAGLLDPARALHLDSTWKKLAADDMAALEKRNLWHEPDTQKAVYEWSAPPQAVLDQAVALRRRLDAQSAALTTADAQRMLLVVGQAPFTPAGYELGPEGLEYLDAADGGDGRVTLENALLPGVATWKVAAVHGKLPDVPAAFEGYIELLTKGATDKLEALAAPRRDARPASALVRSRPSHGMEATQPPSAESDAMGRVSEEPAQGRTAALRVAVLNADLQFIHEPLLVGHYRATQLTGAEAVVDRMVSRAMSSALATGLYPDAPGTHQVFGNERSNPDNQLEMARPRAVVVVGLGEEGKLRTSELVFAVRQAVLAYAQRLTEPPRNAPAQFELAATLMGSGGTGISVGAAAQSIAQGALEANQRLRESGWPQLGRLTLVEVYLDRAGEAWRALQHQETAAPHKLRLEGQLEIRPGAMRRSLDSSYRGANYDFISALTTHGARGEACISYRLDTRRARSEVTAQHAQGALLRSLVASASNDANADPLVGRTLFNLLVPVEIEPFMGGASRMVIEVDAGTAGIPWEMLDTNPDAKTDSRKAWAIRSGLVRKLQTTEFRSRVVDASPDDSVLVIGEPLTDPELYPRLEGARREALAVRARLFAAGMAADKVNALVEHDDAQKVINALFERPYRAVHVSGHGAPGAAGGVVLSGRNVFLGANEVRSMRTAPELVFLNCCHLAARDAARVAAPTYDRAAFAANIAEELIRCGVRCVIAAGWAVEDDAAEKFAAAFYGALLEGARFIDAVAAAREAAWAANPRGNTWAAYQCYGDPDWTWRRAVAGAQDRAPQLGDEFAGVASPVSLTLALENLAIESEYRHKDAQGQLDKVRYLESRFGAVWGAIGAVAESFGVAYAAAEAVDEAIGWYTAAVAAGDGSASFRAAEQLANLRIRRAEKAGDAAAVRAGIAQLEALAALQPTYEREDLLGSACKRLVMIEWRAGRAGPANAALEQATRHYRAAQAMAAARGAADVFYPAKMVMACEARARLQAGQLPQPDARQLERVADLMQKAAAEQPDFWSVVGQTELLVLRAMAQRGLAAGSAGFLASLRDLKARVGAPLKWDSVYNEAQFLLEPYGQLQGRGAEAAAAHALLAELRSMADKTAAAGAGH